MWKFFFARDVSEFQGFWTSLRSSTELCNGWWVRWQVWQHKFSRRFVCLSSIRHSAGNFGRVLKAVHVETKELVAIKLVSVQRLQVAQFCENNFLWNPAHDPHCGLDFKNLFLLVLALLLVLSCYLFCVICYLFPTFWAGLGQTFGGSIFRAKIFFSPSHRKQRIKKEDQVRFHRDSWVGKFRISTMTPPILQCSSKGGTKVIFHFNFSCCCDPPPPGAAEARSCTRRFWKVGWGEWGGWVRRTPLAAEWVPPEVSWQQ